MLRRWLRHGSYLQRERRSFSRQASHSHSPSPSIDLKHVGEVDTGGGGGEGGQLNPALLSALIPRTSYQLKDKAVEYCLRVIDQCERSKLAAL